MHQDKDLQKSSKIVSALQTAGNDSGVYLVILVMCVSKQAHTYHRQSLCDADLYVDELEHVIWQSCEPLPIAALDGCRLQMTDPHIQARTYTVSEHTSSSDLSALS